MKKNPNKKIKIILRIIGFTLLIAGLTLSIIAFCNFGNFDNNLFMLSFLGLPLIGISIALVVTSFSQNISRFIKNEQATIINEFAEDISPAIRSYSSSVKDGLTADNQITCECGAVNSSNAKFCSNCGKALQTTCVSCGKEISVNDKFCPECGTKVE